MNKTDIEDLLYFLKRFGLKPEKRKHYEDGSKPTTPKPIQPLSQAELLAYGIFGTSLDNLTSTQKNALADYIDLPEKKAKGGRAGLNYLLGL